MVYFQGTSHFRLDTMLEVKFEELVELLNANHRVLFPPNQFQLLLRLSAHLGRLTDSSSPFSFNPLSVHTPAVFRTFGMLGFAFASCRTRSTQKTPISKASLLFLGYLHASCHGPSFYSISYILFVSKVKKC